MEEFNKDILVMKLIHYFMVKKDYMPVIIRGIDNEVWLENPKGEFRIIRIVKKNIFNNEQFDFDSFKTKNIVTQIMKQTLNPFIDVLTIYTDIGDNFKKKINNTKKYKYITIQKESDIKNNDLLNKYFSDLKDNMDYKEEDYDLLVKLTTDISEKNSNDNERYNIMYKQKKPIVTLSLIVINILIFILMYVLGKGSEDINTLVNFGAVSTPLIKNGEYFRLITSSFLHIGIIHLICNMYSLYIIGPTIEHFFGKGKFIIIYLYSAIMGSLFAMIFQSNGVVSAGASGAIFGLLGSLLYFGYSYRGYIGNKIISEVLSVIILNLFIGFSIPGISNSSHIGGLIGGYMMSFMLGAEVAEDDKSKRINGFILTLILTIFIIYMAFFK